MANYETFIVAPIWKEKCGSVVKDSSPKTEKEESETSKGV